MQHQTSDDESIKEIYEHLKMLLQDCNTKEARKYLSTIDFLEIWGQLLHRAMRKRNCPVSKLIVVHVVHCRLLTREQIQLVVSKVDHEIQKAFISRLGDYIKSRDFEEKLEGYENVRSTVSSQLRITNGTELLHPKAFN